MTDETFDAADLQYDDCECYECVGPEYAYTDDGHRYVQNNMKHHTLGEPCNQCGRAKGHYRDLGRNGLYVCYWCDGPGYTD